MIKGNRYVLLALIFCMLLTSCRQYVDKKEVIYTEFDAKVKDEQAASYVVDTEDEESLGYAILNQKGQAETEGVYHIEAGENFTQMKRQ